MAARAHRVVVVDVRTPAEFETAHVAGSYNVPLNVLGEHAAEFAARLDREVVLVCQSGARAAQARRHLGRLTSANLHVLDGGVPALTAAGADVVRGEPRWAMDRQVRLAAGSLVLTSILVSLRWPAARFLAGGVGAGLTWSAVSNSCALGNLFGRLPYNRGPAEPNAREVLDRLPHPTA